MHLLRRGFVSGGIVVFHSTIPHFSRFSIGFFFSPLLLSVNFDSIEKTDAHVYSELI